MPEKFYPNIKDLVGIDNIPGDIGIVNSIGTLLDRVFYKNLVLTTSFESGSGYVGLTLVFYKKLSFGIPGVEGMDLSINTGPEGIPEFPVSFYYKWDVLKAIPNFSMEGFSSDPNDIFSSLTAIVGVSSAQALENLLLNCIGGEDPLAEFIDIIESEYGVVLQINNDLNTYILILQDIIDQLENNGLDIYEVIFDYFMSQGSPLFTTKKINN